MGFFEEHHIIRGNKFKDISHVDISLPTHISDMSHIFHSKSCILYCKIDYVHMLFENIKTSQYPHVLITHNGDINITQDLYTNKPKCIKYWFGQNMCIDECGCIGIPIGMENFGVGVSSSYDVIKHTSITSKKDMCYLNVNVYTNRDVRLPMVDILKNKPFVLYNQNVSFDIYTKENGECKYTLSPEGNGVDCIRTWESLYLGNIPIVKSCVALKHFNSLPIIYIEEWENLTMEFIQSYDLTHTSIDMLYMGYWVDRIMLAYNKICGNV